MVDVNVRLMNHKSGSCLIQMVCEEGDVEWGVLHTLAT